MYDRRLIDYLPTFERGFKEFDAILTKAEDPEMVTGWEAIENALDDQSIVDATENGVSRKEKIAGIIPKATETLDERKFTLLVKESEQPPFTIKALKIQLESLCGEGNFDVIRDVESKTLYVGIALAAENSFKDVEVLLERIVPANMQITVGLKYNQYNKFSTFTHEDMQNFTHDQLRNEVE